ncbi:MAG: hypothetical protein NC313_03030 [Butyrivibrio sp.]|nr:hypothetical protein [Butyrivibrio sp.]
MEKKRKKHEKLTVADNIRDSKAADSKSAENLNENTTDIFDSVFKTLLQRFPMLAVALINEVFHVDYAEDEVVIHGRNEYHSLDGKVINDAMLRIRDKIYHIECQSTNDGLMVIRMIEYDFRIAIEETRNILTNELKKKLGERNKEPFIFRFPQSCMVCVRPGIEKKDVLKLQIVMPSGENVLYEVPVLQVQNFSKEEMFQKRLLILIPFYVLRYEKDIKAGKNEILGKLKGEYEYIKKQLTIEGNSINEPRLYYELAVLTQRILDYVGKENEDYKERMGNIMGGVILELESDKIWNRVWNEGSQYADSRRLILDIDNIVKKLNMPLEKACEIQDITVDDYRKAVKLVQETEAERKSKAGNP